MSMEYGSTKYNMIWAAQNRPTELVLLLNMANVPELLGTQNMMILFTLSLDIIKEIHLIWVVFLSIIVEMYEHQRGLLFPCVFCISLLP